MFAIPRARSESVPEMSEKECYKLILRTLKNPITEAAIDIPNVTQKLAAGWVQSA